MFYAYFFYTWSLILELFLWFYGLHELLFFLVRKGVSSSPKCGLPSFVDTKQCQYFPVVLVWKGYSKQCHLYYELVSLFKMKKIHKYYKLKCTQSISRQIEEMLFHFFIFLKTLIFLLSIFNSYTDELTGFFQVCSWI